MNNKPATSLPFKVGVQALAPHVTRIMSGSKCVASVYGPNQEQDAAYMAHAANAYPLLVEQLQEVDDLLPRINDDDPMAPALRDWLRKVRETMRQIGERQ